MPDIKSYQEIYPNSREYLVYSTVEIDETVTLELVFDDDVTLDDIQVHYFTTTSTANPPAGEIRLKYPDGRELTIISSASNWSMNQNADSRNLWYPLPPFSSLSWTPVNPSNGLKAMVVLTAIGRGI